MQENSVIPENRIISAIHDNTVTPHLQSKEVTYVPPAQEGVTLPPQASIEQALEMVDVNGQKVPLNVYLKLMNRHQRRQFLVNFKNNKKHQKHPKTTLTRVEQTQAHTLKQTENILGNG